MFDFEQLNVYQKSLKLNDGIFGLLRANPAIDRFLQDQLKRATVSISANIAEGSGRFTLCDRRHFFVISRGSAFESYSLLQIISNQYSLESTSLNRIKLQVEEITKMLFGLINKIKPKSAPIN
jgi:four helix bundle protein